MQHFVDGDFTFSTGHVFDQGSPEHAFVMSVPGLEQHITFIGSQDLVIDKAGGELFRASVRSEMLALKLQTFARGFVARAAKWRLRAARDALAKAVAAKELGQLQAAIAAVQTPQRTFFKVS